MRHLPLFPTCVLVLCSISIAAAEVKVWQIGSLCAFTSRCETWGSPTVISSEHGPAVAFDGIDDGFLVSDNPIAGWPRFTIEILFRPSAQGGQAQRFLHLGAPNGDRVLIELRMNEHGQWFLDTFILSGTQRRALADPTLLHAPDEWYWAALTYDGTRMTHYVNGQRELEGPVAFSPLPAGATSIGTRMTKESWFKGAIREVRFHDRVLLVAEMQSLTPAAGTPRVTTEPVRLSQ